MSGWAAVAEDFHARVKANCWDSLAGELLQLHQPHLWAGVPVCSGCDREPAAAGDRGCDPVWPCRTYTIIARTMLHTNVETALTALLTVAESGRHPMFR